MKHLNLENTTYIYFEKDFKKWLHLLGYSNSIVKNMPNYIREFFHFCEQQNKHDLLDVSKEDINHYFKYLSERSSHRGGGLGAGSLNLQLEALRNFNIYLRKTGQGGLTIQRRFVATEIDERPTFTQEEIARMYKASKDLAFPLRHKAILSVYYGCGLRRTEGYHLNVEDILLDKNLIHVRKGKGNKERLVPFNEEVKRDLTEYLYDERWYYTPAEEKAFFTTQTGTRLSKEAIYVGLKAILKEAHIIKEHKGLHILRHSIATHLLDSGMKLESIAKFLGHASLESTQIYTHIGKTIRYKNNERFYKLPSEQRL